MNESLRRKFQEFRSGRVKWDVSMASYSTIRAGGPAAALVTAETLPELEELLRWLGENRISHRLIGRGSNILVRDDGFDGVIILLGKGFRTLEPLDSAPGTIDLRVGGGCSLAGLLSWCRDNGVGGMEFIAGIPGSMGGAITMNAGAWGRSMKDVVHGITVVDQRGEVHEIGRQHLRFAYRRLEMPREIADRAVIVEARLSLYPEEKKTIRQTCQAHLARRRKNQPRAAASAGSFFRNPAGDFAGRLIEAAGLKGLQRGAAMVSRDHANFIINTGGASARDITDLAGEVQERVLRHSGVQLEPEVHII